MDTETAANILTESHTHITEAKWCGLTHTLICKALQAGKFWDEIQGILRLKLCNANIHHISCFMEIQQKDIWTLAAYVHCLKPAAKQCAFDNDNAAIHIFCQRTLGCTHHGSQDLQKGPSDLSEVISLVEKLCAAQQLTATLILSIVSMMCNDDRCLFVDEQAILATTAPMHSVTAVMNLVTLHGTAPATFLPQEHHATKTDCIQGINKSTLEGTNHAPPTMVTDMGDISTDHNHATIPTMTGAAVWEGIHCAHHPTTAAAHAALQPKDAHIGISAMTQPTSMSIPHPAFATSPTDVTHAAIPWTWAGLNPATRDTLYRKQPMRKAKPCPRPSTPHKSISRLSSSRTPHQILPQIQTVTLIL